MRLRITCARAVLGGVALVAALVWGAPAAALQLSLAGDERINEFGNTSGLPGTPYQTPADGVDYDQIGSGEAHPGETHIGGTIPTLNYHTTGSPGTNVAFDFDPDLTFTLDAELTDITLEDAGGGDVTLTIEFSGTADGQPDLVVTDPSDGTVVLEADLVAGDVGGDPVAALNSEGTFDPDAPPSGQTLTTFGFFQVDSSSPYASLFADSAAGRIGLDVGIASGFEIGDSDGSGDFDDLFNNFSDPPQIGELLSHTAEANGDVFTVSSSTFTPVPEPTTVVLLGTGLAGLGVAGRRRAPRRPAERIPGEE